MDKADVAFCGCTTEVSEKRMNWARQWCETAGAWTNPGNEEEEADRAHTL
jgi:hypothetical protein